jgi:hypothetical protein
LGTFARSAIESRFGKDLAGAVRAALVHYTRRLRSARRPPGFPSFRRDEPPDESGAAFELMVDPEIERTLAREGRRQGAPLAQMVTHAVFVYLADIEAATESSGEPTAPPAAVS